MNLIIDTSSEKLKVILDSGAKVTESTQTSSKHLQHLLPEIDKLLNGEHKILKDIDNFCVVVGPGSFTGIRIAITTIKAFLLTLNKTKCIAINMLELLSDYITKNLKVKTPFHIVIKSTLTKFYYAHADKNGKILETNLLSYEEIFSKAKEESPQIFSYNQEFTYNNLTATTILLTTEDYLSFVKDKIANKQYTTENDLKPVYLALSQAEEELLKKEKLNKEAN